MFSKKLNEKHKKKQTEFIKIMAIYVLSYKYISFLHI